MYYLGEGDFRYHCVAKSEREREREEKNHNKDNNPPTPPPPTKKRENKLHILQDWLSR